MKIIDCIWEQRNIGKRTAEIMIEKGDVFSADVINNLIGRFQYVVVKVPVKMIDFNFGLSSMGFTMIETQFNLSKRYKDFDFNTPYISTFYSDVDFEEVKTLSQLDDIVYQMTSEMFSTDRITLDPQFGKSTGMKRYHNWMKTEYEVNRSQFLKILYRGEHIGFSMFRVNENKVDGVLGGIYKQFQDDGMGILTPASLFLYAKKKNVAFRKMVTAVSSNNMPVIQLYNLLNFKIDSMSYVFVKHLN